MGYTLNLRKVNVLDFLNVIRLSLDYMYLMICCLFLKIQMELDQRLCG